MDGIYGCTMQTPFGAMKGKIMLKQDGNALNGKFQAMGIQSEFSNGIVQGNHLSFSGVIRSLLGNITYEAEGIYQENKIQIKANTNQGIFEIKGEKEQEI